MFDKREMTRSFAEVYAPTTYLKDRYFSPVEFHKTMKIDIDKIKGDRAVSTYVSKEDGSIKVDDKTFDTSSFTVPAIKEHTFTTAGQLIDERLPGENIYEDVSPAERSQIKLAQDQAMLSDRADRAEEKQCSELLQTGIVTVVYANGAVGSIDFGLLASHKVSLLTTDAWDDAGSNPVADLLAGFEKIKDDSGKLVSDVIMGSDAASAFINNTSIAALLDNRRTEMGEINPRELNAQGVRYVATLKRPTIDIWEYVELYDSPTSTKQVPYIDRKKVVMIGEGADFRQHYGPIHDIELIDGIETAESFLTQRFFKTVYKDDPSSRKLIMQSCPLMAAHQINALYVITALE
jgi:hypothetical protein